MQQGNQTPPETKPEQKMGKNYLLNKIRHPKNKLYIIRDHLIHLAPGQWNPPLAEASGRPNKFPKVTDYIAFDPAWVASSRSPSQITIHKIPTAACLLEVPKILKETLENLEKPYEWYKRKSPPQASQNQTWLLTPLRLGAPNWERRLTSWPPNGGGPNWGLGEMRWLTWGFNMVSVFKPFNCACCFSWYWFAAVLKFVFAEELEFCS